MSRWVMPALLALLLFVTSPPDAAGGPLDGVYAVSDLGTFGDLNGLTYITPVTQDGRFINFFFLFGAFWTEAFGQLDAAGVARGNLFEPSQSPFLGPGGQTFGTFEAEFLPPEECPPARFPGCFIGSITVNGVTSEFVGVRVFGSN